MTIVCINAVPYGSTGNIMFQIADMARKQGHKVYTFSKPINDFVLKKEWEPFHSNINTLRGVSLTARLSAYTGVEGVFARKATKEFLHKMDLLKPNVIHLHNLHGWFINYEMLFSYIKKNDIKVIWTLHDCWSFTGHCPYFTMEKCEKWKTGCHNCATYKEYPQSKIDHTRLMWCLKKQWFSGVKNMTIVTPSQWLADLVKQSFLKEYTVKVINNGIDLDVFKPTLSDFRQNNHIPVEKFLILGVAAGWEKRKGLDVFVNLYRRLDPTKYQIVLVGTDEMVDKELPDGIISIHSTHNQFELAELYTAADLFLNPTREENYPTVNMESIACGTPVLTFRTGGSPEIIDRNTGKVVDCDDIEGLERAIMNLYNTSFFTVDKCTKKAMTFNKNELFAKYVKLMEEICDEQQNI